MGTWVEPKFSRSQVEKAGKILVQETVTEPDRLWALEVLDNWRAAHSFPMNTFQMSLRKNARKVCGSNVVIAQRLKRTPSIIAKLQRAPEDQKMSLKRMQDIAGCRAIVPTVAKVYDLQDHYCNAVTHQHELINTKDYIASPKPDGYRSIHMVYKFHSTQTDKYNNQLVEIQLRSQLQHCWATALETVDIMNQTALKLGRGGSDKWSRFFRLMSSVFAIEEKTGDLEVSGSERQIRSQASALAKELDAKTRLKNFQVLLSPPDQIKNAAFYLMVLNPSKNELRVTTFSEGRIAEATHLYSLTEERFRNMPGAQVVLVSAGSVNALRKAYPNYYADTDMFIAKVDALLQ